MSWTRKIAGWTAGRLKGEKARKKTMDWMEKTGLGKALSIGGDIGIGLAGGKLAKMGGAALKGMFAGGGGAGSAVAGASKLPAGVTELGRLASASPAESGGMVANMMAGAPGTTLPAFTPSAAGQAASSAVQRIGQGLVQQAGQGAAPATLRNLLTNPQVIAGMAGGVADVMGQRSQQRIAEQQLAQQGEQFQQRFDVEEEERKRQQAQANRLAGFFMPRAQG